MLGNGAIEPMTTKIKMGNVAYVFSHQLLENIMEVKLAAAMDAHLEWCDIILGGNHGQGAFWWPVKLVLRYNNQSVIELEKWLAEIVCKKESYKLFQKMLAKPLRKSMLSMYEDKTISTDADQDGS